MLAQDKGKDTSLASGLHQAILSSKSDVYFEAAVAWLFSFPTTSFYCSLTQVLQLARNMVPQFKELNQEEKQVSILQLLQLCEPLNTNFPQHITELTSP